MKHIFLLLSFLSSLAYADSDITIAHINDHHSSLDPQKSTLILGGRATQVTLGGFPRVAAMIKKIRQQNPEALVLHAGDALTGSLYYTLFKGKVDAAMMNAVCFDAMAIGNHEFDDSDAGLRAFIQDLHEGSCQTAMLSANIEPAVGTPLRPTSESSLIAPYTIVERNGRKIGIIGLTIALKTKESSSPLPTTRFLDEKTSAQKNIDILKKQGIDTIVLLTHYQYQNDIALAQSLQGVDVIVGGDSHDLLGNFSAYGLQSTGPYPSVVRNLDGDPVCVATAWQYSQLVGELQVKLDDLGRVKTCGGTPHLLLSEEFQDLAGNDPQLSSIAEDPATAKILETYRTEVAALASQKIGETADDLCLVRIPGIVPVDPNLPDAPCTGDFSKGSDITHVVAEAFLEQSKRAQVSIQNAGGVRRSLYRGDISIALAYELLPFANTLYNLEMSGAEISNVLEDAMDYALNPLGSGGAYPYAYGLRYDIRLGETKGHRIQNIEVRPKDETAWRPLQLGERLIVVTNDYIASGKDGYLTFGTIPAAARENTYLSYTRAFLDYVQTHSPLYRLPRSDYSTKSLTQ